jgi:hypothetical protein
MNPHLETYLRRASSGVSAAHRAVIRDELRANIDLRASELELLGLTHAQGVERALEELGAPQRISGGMAWVYTAPRAVRWAFTALLVAFCCIAPLHPLTVQVQASAVTDSSGTLTGVRLETNSFSTALAAAGIPLTDATQQNAGMFGQRFTTARSWDDSARRALRAPVSPLELRDALNALCDLSASVTLEDTPSAVVFRVTWQGNTSRIALNLDGDDVNAFHARLGRSLERPCGS